MAAVTTMPVTAEQWAAHYEACGLAGTHCTAPRFVILPLLGGMSVINTPGEIGEQMLSGLKIRGLAGPVLAREKPVRCTFLVRYDRTPCAEVRTVMDRYGIDIGPHRANVILPTGYGRLTREHRYWLHPPRRGGYLPPLSEVVAVLLGQLRS
ncbi:hypothetical protein AB4305_24035 [Nocardia sp. 2YAB30]|uniref:hypothetical protein n=1 Tax=unclassified Nocardia TaxID=2637762 RepID=UPI003F967B83